MPAPALVADRFIATGGAWLDLATGATVHLRVQEAGTRGEQLDWSARCAMLANLRHPVLNTLIDFGALDRRRVFEAYEVRGAVLAGGAQGALMLGHAARFLETHGVALPGTMAAAAMRPIAAGPSRGVPIGVVIQRRDACDAVTDALDATGPPGACEIHIHGPRHAGLRTLRTMAARAARLRGYVPVSASLAGRAAWLAALLDGRHVCLMEETGNGGEREGPGVRRRMAAFLARTTAAGGRRHVVLSFTRAPARDAAAVPLDRMGVTAMSAMIFVDSQCGPDAADVLRAARQADGLPGLVLEALNAFRIDSCRPAAALVRERAPVFADSTAHAPAAAGSRPRRHAGMLLRASRRAGRLAAAGRHMTAARILERAVRVLAGRGEREHAAACALALGRIARDRGRIDAAVDAFERARELEPDGSMMVAATIELGTTWIDDARMVDAEAALRTAHLAAGALTDRDLAERAAGALAECLVIQGRADEAAALPAVRAAAGADRSDVALCATAARVALARGDVPGAIATARRGLARAAALRDPRSLAMAHRSLAEALNAAGDRLQAGHHLHEALAAARAAHLPVEAARVRTLQLKWEASTAARRLRAARLQSMSGSLPRLVRMEVLMACAEAAGAELDTDTRRWMESQPWRAGSTPAASAGALVELEAFLERCRMAPDDRTAIEQVCADLQRQLRAVTVLVIAAQGDERVLALAGRPWPGEPHAARRVLASGLGAPPETATEPCQAAEPLRYGGETIAALACRWAPGVALDPARVSSLLRMAALAASASVRALLDRTPPSTAAGTPDDLVGSSDAARALREAVARAARAPFPVLIEGESGSGKELVARAIHRLSARRERRFCPLNCAALSDDLIEAELFGHARGAFTGAVGERPGLFEEADGGTLFLDEIGELSPRAQAKLLRVLQDGEVRRVGENIARRVDVRIVAATNRRLQQEAAAGRFRTDLRFRLDVVRIDVPPLRDRPGDVPLLASHFWADTAARVGARATLAPEVLAALARYDWPGNVRELQNVIAWMAVHSPQRGRIGVAALPAHVAHSASPCRETFEAARAEFERRFVRAALATANGQRSSAAAALGVSRQGLAKMLRRLGIEGT